MMPQANYIYRVGHLSISVNKPLYLNTDVSRVGWGSDTRQHNTATHSICQ